MKIVFKTVIIILTILLVANLFFWAAMHGSGHKVPTNTNWSFAITSIAFLFLLIGVIYFRNKI